VRRGERPFGLPSMMRPVQPSPVSRIDHVAIRVRSLDEARAAFVDGLGFEETSAEATPDGTRVAYLRLHDWEFEVFEDPEGDPGLDHIALGIDDVGAAAGALDARGVRFAGDELSGTRQSRALVVDTATTAGIRMHLCARPTASK